MFRILTDKKSENRAPAKFTNKKGVIKVGERDKPLNKRVQISHGRVATPMNGCIITHNSDSKDLERLMYRKAVARYARAETPLRGGLFIAEA